MKSEIEKKADFTKIRYAQCWEDADILLSGLDMKDGATVLSIASAGDNTLSLLTKKPAKVYALDLSMAQIACLDLRKWAYKVLTYEEMIELLGVVRSDRRLELYDRIKNELSQDTREFWNENMDKIETGVINTGKFEKYFELFRNKILPLVHSRKEIEELLKDKTKEERAKFYDHIWNNLRWKFMFKMFFSKFVMGRLGRDKAFFKYVHVNVAENILKRVKYALVELNPAENPYLQFILRGRYDETLPHALRRENFAIIKENIDRLEYRKQSVEEFLDEIGDDKIDAFNLSDIFEYMSELQMERIYTSIIKSAKLGAKVAYWNMLAHRECPESFGEKVEAHIGLAEELFLKDKAFFYSAFRVEEVRGK